MKNYTLLLFLFIAPISFGQIIYEESFETITNGTNYDTSVLEFTDNDADFFIRTDGSNITSGYQVNGADGSFYFAAQDIDGEGATPPLFLTTPSINITGISDLNFSILLAEDDEGTDNHWDASDYFHIMYSIDGGANQNLLWVENDGTTFNSAPLIDTDFDGIGDGIEITNTFTEFTKSIAVSGSSIVFTLEYFFNSGNEDISIDDIKVTNANPLSLTDKEISNFQIYPNPSKDGSVTIINKGYKSTNISIYNVLGNLVYAKKMNKPQLTLSNLSKGIYLVRIDHKEMAITKKLVIQ